MRTAFKLLAAICLPLATFSQTSEWDADQDAMPDEWEFHRGLNISDPSDAWGDLDEDGVLNIQEYLLGADPQDPNDPETLNFTSETSLATAIKNAPRGAVLRVPTGTYSLNYSFQRLDEPPRLLIQGGWNTDFTERDYCASPTVFDGGNQGAILNYLIDEGNSSALILDGISLVNAGREAIAYTSYLSKVQLMLANCTIRDNRPHRASSVVRFEDARATAISDFLLINTSVTDNMGTGVQAIMHGNITNIKILHSVVAYNEPADNDEAPYQSGHGVQIDSDAPEPVAVQFANSIFWENRQADVYIDENVRERLRVHSRYNVFGFIQPDAAYEWMTHPSDGSLDPNLIEAADGRYYLDENSRYAHNGLNIGLSEAARPDIGLLPCAARQTTAASPPFNLGESLSIWPNPVAGEALYVQLEEKTPTPKAVQVYSITGRLMRTIPMNREDRFLSIPIGDLPAGYYELVLRGVGAWGAKRFVKL